MARISVLAAATLALVILVQRRRRGDLRAHLPAAGFNDDFCRSCHVWHRPLRRANLSVRHLLQPFLVLFNDSVDDLVSLFTIELRRHLYLIGLNHLQFDLLSNWHLAPPLYLHAPAGACVTTPVGKLIISQCKWLHWVNFVTKSVLIIDHYSLGWANLRNRR